MKYFCVMCGRLTKPSAFIGQEVVGPKCMRRLGLNPAKAGLLPKSWRNSRLKFLKPVKAESNGQGDLFDGVNDE